jgi:hypothetical protein
MTEAPVSVEALGRVRVSVPRDPAFRTALRLLVGGIGSRSELSYDQVDELQLAVDAVLAHRTVAGDSLQVKANLDGDGLSLVLGSFVPEDDPGGLRVLERLVGRVRVLRSDHGDEWIELQVGRPANDHALL